MKVRRWAALRRRCVPHTPPPRGGVRGQRPARTAMGTGSQDVVQSSNSNYRCGVADGRKVLNGRKARRQNRAKTDEE